MYSSLIGESNAKFLKVETGKNKDLIYGNNSQKSRVFRIMKIAIQYLEVYALYQLYPHHSISSIRVTKTPFLLYSIYDT